jgi:hypothetical protein
MQSFTVEQWLIVALVFVAGWLLGLASHPGGRKWRERYAAERDAHAAYRRDADARVATAETRHRELETEHARVIAAPATTTGTTTIADTSRRPVERHPVETRVIRPTAPAGERRGWFDFGHRRR